MVWNQTKSLALCIGNKQIEHLNTIEKDGKLYQVFNLLRVNRLRTAILSNSIDEIGKFKTVERLVNLNVDKKRLWFKEIKIMTLDTSDNENSQ